MKYHEVKKFARDLRSNPTEPEKILWPFLRKRQLEGRLFLRQHPVLIMPVNEKSFYFIPDFFCYQENLAIELDGGIHNFTKDRDAVKDNILLAKGIKVIRIENSELENIETVLSKIRNHFSI